MRLNRYLAAAGLASRRGADELIAAGRVTVNGQVCTNFGTDIAEADHVKVDGRRVQSEQRLHVALHKPAGFVSTRHDPHARDTIFDLLPPGFPRLFNVGRLDAMTEGLLILTNDGELAQKLSHPRYKVEKEYEVTLDRPWNPERAPELLKGVFLDGLRARFARLEPIGPKRLRVILQQGVNRQIRRMMFAVGYEVTALVRTRIGRLRLGDLPRGHWRPLTSAEIRELDPDTRRQPTNSGKAKPRRGA